MRDRRLDPRLGLFIDFARVSTGGFDRWPDDDPNGARFLHETTARPVITGIVRDGQLVRYRDGAVAGVLSEPDFDRVVSVNLKGTFLCARAVAPAMIRQRAGVILNAASVVGLDGNFGQTNYVASKAGVIGMTRVWARELGRYGVRVNAVAPGFTATEMVQQMPEKVLQGMTARTPLGRIGQPRDIANAYLFLASDDASFVTGQMFYADGGWGVQGKISEASMNSQLSNTKDR